MAICDKHDECLAAAAELEAMIATAVQLVGGTREAIAFAKKRHAMWKVRSQPVMHVFKVSSAQ